MAERKPPLTSEEAESLESAIVQVAQEVRVLRQAIDEFRVDFTHLLRNLPDNLPPPYQHLAGTAEAFALEHVGSSSRDAKIETLCCYECGTQALPGLAQALQDGWIDITCAEEEFGANFAGWCTNCQQAYEEEDQRLNSAPPSTAKRVPASDQFLPSIRSEQLANNPHEEHTHFSAATEPTSDSARQGPPAAVNATATTNVASLSADSHLQRNAGNETTVDFQPPSEEFRKNTPLLTRLYLHRYMEAVVRAIGYENLSRDAALERLNPLIEQYGRDTIEQAANELLGVDANSPAREVRLKNHVRQLARGILGPPPNLHQAILQKDVDKNPLNTESRESARAETVGPPAAKATSTTSAEGTSRPVIVPMTNRSMIKPVNLSRRDALAEFQSHIEARRITFERIDNATRLKYTDKHLGALDFIIREENEPPELVTIRKTVTTTQVHDLMEWKAIIGQDAFASMIWPYIDAAGRQSWETTEIDGSTASPQKMSDPASR